MLVPKDLGTSHKRILVTSGPIVPSSCHMVISAPGAEVANTAKSLALGRYHPLSRLDVDMWAIRRLVRTVSSIVRTCVLPKSTTRPTTPAHITRQVVNTFMRWCQETPDFGRDAHQFGVRAATASAEARCTELRGIER